MDKDNTQKLQPDDFAMALQELDTFVDISVDDLMQLHQSAEKFARMRTKGSLRIVTLMTQPVTTVQPNCSLADAAHILVTAKISGLPVVDDKHQLVGIITEADFLRALGIPAHHPKHSLWQTLESMFKHELQVREPEGLVADLMRTEVITASPQQTLHQALDIMKQHEIKRLIVCNEVNHVVGIITRSDLVRVFFDHFKTTNKDISKG
ncbi:MAG: CBS domain-containing protein [Gammaproteobacteria bacterium]|nr:CBS domain-containing protein [Gammaproteobacteria bacterium]